MAIGSESFPFEKANYIPNDVTLAAMDAAEKGEDMNGTFDCVEDLVEALNLSALAESIAQMKQGKVVIKTLDELAAIENE